MNGSNQGLEYAPNINLNVMNAVPDRVSGAHVCKTDSIAALNIGEAHAKQTSKGTKTLNVRHCICVFVAVCLLQMH